MARYRPGAIDAELDVLLGGPPAVALEGPKGVGKTSTAARRARTVFRLDLGAHRALLDTAPVHSGASRIVTLRMRPRSIAERAERRRPPAPVTPVTPPA